MAVAVASGRGRFGGFTVILRCERKKARDGLSKFSWALIIEFFTTCVVLLAFDFRFFYKQTVAFVFNYN